MDDGLGSGNEAPYGCGIADIAAERFDRGLERSIVQRYDVQRAHRLAALQQLSSKMQAEKSCTPRDPDGHLDDASCASLVSLTETSLCARTTR